MSNLPTLTVDFTADRHTQYLFFLKKVWKVTAKDIVEIQEWKRFGRKRLLTSYQERRAHFKIVLILMGI
jgi:hypothetical protein